MIDLLHIPELY